MYLFIIFYIILFYFKFVCLFARSFIHHRVVVLNVYADILFFFTTFFIFPHSDSCQASKNKTKHATKVDIIAYCNKKIKTKLSVANMVTVKQYVSQQKKYFWVNYSFYIDCFMCEQVYRLSKTFVVIAVKLCGRTCPFRLDVWRNHGDSWL